MIRDDIHTALADGLADMGARDVSFAVEYPPAQSGADYATNAALVAGKVLKRPPADVARELAAKLQGKIPSVERAEVAGLGFVNFFLGREAFAQAVRQAGGEGERWGRGEVRRSEEILVEYTSPNLFKPLHIGNLVGNILGESLARIFEAQGAQVRRLNYPSDIGLTVAKGVWGLKTLGLDPENIADLGKAYVAGSDAYEKEDTAKREIDAINQALYAGDNAELSALRAKGIETSRRHLDDICAQLGTRFDKELFESESGPVGRELVLQHVEDGIFERSEGAVVYRGEKEGLHTRVFLNSQGLPTYEAKELGLFDLKFHAFPDFKSSYTVTGSEQKDFFRVVREAIRDVFGARVEGRDYVRHIASGMLTLTTGKMSSRKGNVITGESLIEDMISASKEKMGERELSDKEAAARKVAVAAIKYTVLKQGSGKNIMFDPEKSLSLEGDTGPYLQYAHTRCRSIMRKAREEGVQTDASVPTLAVSGAERLLPRFPEIAMRAAQEHEPHYITQYLTELSSEFNHWYAKERVLDGTPAAPYKLALVEAVGQTLRNGLWMLGIEAPEEM